VKREAADRGAPGALQRVVQQPVGVGAALAGAEEVRAVVVDRIDLRRVDDVLDVDDPTAVAAGGVDLLLVDDDVLARAHLVPAHDLVARHLTLVLRAEAPVLDARAVGHVDLLEVHPAGVDRGVQLDRHGDGAEHDRAVPQGASCAGHAHGVPRRDANRTRRAYRRTGAAANRCQSSPAR
jgi:hypothetical protein